MQIKDCKIIPISSTREEHGQLIEERRFFFEATMDDKSKVILPVFNILLPEDIPQPEATEPDEADEPEEEDESDDEDEEEKEEVPVAKKRTGNFI